MYLLTHNINRLLSLLLLLGTVVLNLHKADGRLLTQLRRRKMDFLIDRLGLRETARDLEAAGENKRLITDLDQLRGMFTLVRRITMKQAHNDMDKMYNVQRQQGKMQERILRSEDFPCGLAYARSPTPPTSVNHVRPGDIDLIASMGDSLSAGNGLISENILHIVNEFRGISFSGGGMGDWRTFLTLPNIIKVFNPNLYGYSIANELTIDRTSRLNIAEPMIMSRDLPYQARIYIERLRRDPLIDIEQHWKLLTIFTGNNDICSDSCHYDDPNRFVERHEIDLRQMLTMLREAVPRLIVNLLPVPNMVTSLFNMDNKVPMVCAAMHKVGCHCVFSDRMSSAERQRISEVITRWQNVEQYVAALPEFNTDDFAVVYQPFTANVSMRMQPNGSIDLRYFASDCFHFSQLGHAAMASSLWNNMMQPIGQKQLDMSPPLQDFECPSAERPFIATLGNSLTNWTEGYEN